MRPYPTESDIRAALIERVTAYCQSAGLSPKRVCRLAIHDPNFFDKVKGGDNFTVRTYQRVHRWIDRHPPAAQRRARKTNGAR